MMNKATETTNINNIPNQKTFKCECAYENLKNNFKDHEKKSKKIPLNRPAIFLLLAVLWLVFSVKDVDAYQGLPGEDPVESSTERFGVIRGYRRRIGLLESLESLELYSREQRLTKDNVWIVREGVSIFVTPERPRPVVRVPPESRVLSLEEIENGERLVMFVVCDIYDTANEHVLIAAGSQIYGPMEVRIADGQISLTITGNSFLEEVFKSGGIGLGGHFIEPRTLTGGGWRDWQEVDFEKWYTAILRNPPLSATLLFTDLDDAEESDSLKLRFSRDAEGQIHLHLPDIFELIVHRPLYFSNPTEWQPSAVGRSWGYFFILHGRETLCPE